MTKSGEFAGFFGRRATLSPMVTACTHITLMHSRPPVFQSLILTLHKTPMASMYLLSVLPKSRKAGVINGRARVVLARQAIIALSAQHLQSNGLQRRS